MLLHELAVVLANCDPASDLGQYRQAVVESNVVGKDSLSSRQRTFRYLREMYALDLYVPPFRALLRLWRRDRAGRPVAALLLAASRDAALAATAPAVLRQDEGAAITYHDLAAAVKERYPGTYSLAVANKIGRNALSSWTQAGYLTRSEGGPAVRSRLDPAPASVAMALVLATQQGLSGARLFASDAGALLGAPTPTLHDRAHEAGRKGWLEYRSRGNVTEIDVSALTADPQDPRLPITEGDAR
jgi:hypothetical protein